MPFGFILKQMVTSPRCFDVGFVSGIRLDLLSEQSHVMLRVKLKMGVPMFMFELNARVVRYVLVLVRETH